MITVGIDEVGRGCWAGPVVAGAVILKEPLAGLKDSKLLTKKQREKLAELIEQTSHIGLGWVPATEVDQIGLTAAVKLAMERALSQIEAAYDEIIIDGHLNFLIENSKAKAVIKADQTVPAVSAASIVAKVARDNYMAQQSSQYPSYGFDKHVGYGTALHLERLKLHGVSQLHRRSFKPVRQIMEAA